jgi:hypothetical protein
LPEDGDGMVASLSVLTPQIMPGTHDFTSFTSTLEWNQPPSIERQIHYALVSCTIQPIASTGKCLENNRLPSLGLSSSK